MFQFRVVAVTSNSFSTYLLGAPNLPLCKKVRLNTSPFLTRVISTSLFLDLSGNLTSSVGFCEMKVMYVLLGSTFLPLNGSSSISLGFGMMFAKRFLDLVHLA